MNVAEVNKYLISKEGVEEVSGFFLPFENSIVVAPPKDDEPVAPTQPVPDPNDELHEEIQQLNDQINILTKNKEQLENEIRSWEEKKLNLQKEQEQIVSQNKAQGETILSNAHEEAKEIIAKANEERKKVESETAQNQKKVITEFRKQGYRDGFQKGFQKGEQEREVIENYLKKILNEALNKKEQIVESIRQHLVELVFTAVQKVVKKITEQDKKVVLKNIVNALRQIDDPVKLIIKVSYEDIKATTAFKSQLLSSLKNLKHVEVIADPSVETGGCIVETEFTIIDSRISTQLDKIGLALNSLDVVKSRSR